MDLGCAELPSSGEPYSGGKDRRDRAIQKCAAVVDKDAELDPFGALDKNTPTQMRPAGNGRLT